MRGSLQQRNNTAADTEERKKLRKDKTNIIRREKKIENKGRKCKAKAMATRWQTKVYALSPWSMVVIEKVLVAEVVKKFVAIYVA